MLIKDIFAKPIDRDIKGVIKVGQSDDENISQELEEYVVTKELKKHFAEFFNSYKKGINGHTDKMGVWISGFFGSGKSHFLKILSYILENKEVNGKTAFDYFVDDNKIKDETILADMQLATSVSADVVLFNIDSKSEVGAKQSKTAIVSVLQNVFNEMLGFSGSNPHLAELERNLNQKNEYNKFKQRFSEIFGASWEDSRSDFDFIQDDVVQCLSDINAMSEESARTWCEKATQEYKYRVEDFAKLVKQHIDSKPNNHHVVFLIDEVGQYIGNDSNLMLNLQTVVEDLGIFCKGKAWVIVTSQQAIDDITTVSGNDFSKIQGRFDTRLSLSSANVDEVIKKRILAKTQAAKQALSMYYDQNSTIIKNLIMFSYSAEMKLFNSANTFADVYPFIPYQFNLLGEVLTSIREHSASGKHLAEGERSMLALFKESAMKLTQLPNDAFVPFNLFYDALEQFLDHSHKGVITKALDNSIINPDSQEDCFSVNVLKTLLMLKHVKIIKSNLNNLTSLMVSSVNDDIISLKNNVEKSLKLLTSQMLVQKQNDFYEFLTNEEQEINRAIDKQNVETTEVLNNLAETIFEDIYSETKYSYPEFKNRYSFGFNRFLDDSSYKSNANHAINLKIISPYNQDRDSEFNLKSMSLTSPSVLVVLPDDDSYLHDITTRLKIDKFLRFNSDKTIRNIDSIRIVKREESTELRKSASLFLNESIKASAIYVNGNKFQTNTKEIKSKINEALAKLVSVVYHKIHYIDTPFSNEDMLALLKQKHYQSIITGVNAPNKLALDDLLAYISSHSQMHNKISLKTIIDRFTKAPYGFIEQDIYWLVAKLFKDSEIAFTFNNESISIATKSADEINNYITRRTYSEKLMIEKRIKANEIQIKAACDLMKKLFDSYPINADDDQQIMQQFIEKAKNMQMEFSPLKANYNYQKNYPGKEIIQTGENLLSNLLNIRNSVEFYNYIRKNTNDFLDFSEDFDTLIKFFKGDQKALFDSSLKLMDIYNDSKNYFENEDLKNTAQSIMDILNNANPYNLIFNLPTLNENFRNSYNDILNKELEPISYCIAQAKESVFNKLEGKLCQTMLKDKFIKAFADISNKSQSCNNVSRLKAVGYEADTLKIRCLNEIDAKEAELIQQAKQSEQIKAIGTANARPTPPAPPIKKRKNISIKSINPTTSWQLETEQDVKKHISQLENSLLKQLEKDTIINLEL